MVRWGFLLVFTGCSTASVQDRRPIAEWHTSSKSYRLAPVREEVKIFDDGFVEARFETSGELSAWKEFAPRERRFVLTAPHRDSLVRLLRDLGEVRNDWEDTGRVCVLVDPGPPPYERVAVIRYAPVPGVEWEVRRSDSDVFWGFQRMSPELRRRADAVDAFFRELLWKDGP